MTKPIENAPQPQQEELEVGTCSSLDVPHPYCHVGSWRPIVQRCEHGIRPPHECRDCFDGSVKAISSQPQPAESDGFQSALDAAWKKYRTLSKGEFDPQARMHFTNGFLASRQSLPGFEEYLSMKVRAEAAEAKQQSLLAEYSDSFQQLGVSSLSELVARYDAKLSSLLAQKPEARVSGLVERIASYIESDSECLMPIVVEETKKAYGVRLLKVMADEIRQLFKDAEKGQGK